MLSRVWFAVVFSSTLTLSIAAASAQPSDVPDPSASSAKPQPFVGLAQAPEANLFAGSAATAIAIEVPSGRKSLTPRLALGYSSSSGASAYGFGWSLPLGAIQRSNKRGVLSCNDPAVQRDFVVVLPDTDLECTLDGGTAVWRSCRARVEESFLRIDYDSSSNRWQVWSKDGLRYSFGDSEGARTGSVTQVGWDSASPCRYTYSWALTGIEDPNGNRIEINYDRVEGVLYPREVLYGGNPAQGLAHQFQVRFQWRGRAPGDTPINSMGGFPARLTRLLQSIDVSYPVGAAALRSYRFSYDFESGAESRIGRRSLLRAVTLYGRSGLALARADGLPASTTFLYHQAQPSDRKFEGAAKPWPSSVKALRFENGSAEHRDLRVDLRDMNGDGILDLVDTMGCGTGARRWQVYLGTSSGFEDQPIDWGTVDVDWACRISNTDVDETDADTDHDTIDINGDGFPDLVNARTLPWEVYFGRPPAGATGWHFDAAPTAWSAVVTTYLNQVVFTLRASDQGRGWVDLIDWNGDGLVDLVNARTGRVHYNTGTGFESSGVPVTFPNERLRHGGQHHVREGLYDLNGDGLPDFVSARDNAEDWDVYLNQGRALASVSQPWHAPPDCGDRISSMVGGDQTERDLVDINGDGLLDLVETCHWTPAEPYWRVRLNYGSGFREQISWRSPLRWLRNENDCAFSTDNRCTYYATIDGDGDGIVDILDSGGEQEWENPEVYWMHHNGSGAWSSGCDGVCANAAGGKPDLLIEIQNGIGATTHLTYRPSTEWDNTDRAGVPRLPFVLWTPSLIVQDSGLSGLGEGAATLRNEIRYSYGRFDPVMREFRGFGAVYTMNGGGTQTTTLFKQDAVRKGRIEQVRVTAPGRDPDSDVPLITTVNQWSCVDPASGATRTCPEVLNPGERRALRLAATHRYTYNSNGVDDLLFKHSAIENLTFDSYGNVTRSKRSGDNGTPDLDTYTDYAVADLVSAGSGRYQADKPSHVRIVSGGTLSEKWFLYDDQPLGQLTKGDLTREENWLDTSATTADVCSAASTKRCVVRRMQYDSVGNLVLAHDPNGGQTTTSYDALRLYPVSVTNPAGQTVNSQFDVGCGRLTASSIPNGSAAHLQVYDSFCRLIEVYLPGQTSPQRRLHYYLGSPGVATDVHSQDAETGSPTGWNDVDQLFDALGRPLQRLRTTSIEGSRRVVAEATSAYDERGELQRVRSPFTTSYAFGPGGIALYRPGGEADTTFERDALGRIVRSRQPDGGEKWSDFTTAWQTTAYDACYVAADCLGSKIVEVSDATGAVIEKRIFEEGVGGDTLKAASRYTYDGAGRLLTTTQWDGTRYLAATRIAVTYDSLGRKIEMSDPDSGNWKYGYDRSGNLVYEDDPKLKQHVQFCYDAIGRVSRKYVFRDRDFGDVGIACGGADLVDTSYWYDHPNGYLTRVDDRSGSTYFDSYDVQGRARRITRDLLLGTTRERAVTNYNYDRVGHLTAITYPDGEVVTYDYDDAGQVEAMRSSDGTVYLANQTYDLLGRPRQTTHGNGPNGVGVVDVHEYGDATELHRLKKLYVAPHPRTVGVPTCATGGKLLDLSYQYTAAGLLGGLNDGNSACAVLSNSATYAYDGLGRLSQVSGNPAVNGTFTYDWFGNLLQKDGKSFVYSGSKPHTATAYDGKAITYDKNGNRTAKSGASYEYGPEDRLERINGGQTSLVHDYTGRQALKLSIEGTTRYFDQFSEYRTRGTEGILTKYYFAGPQRIASRESRWTPQLLMSEAHSPLLIAGLSTGHLELIAHAAAPLRQTGGFGLGALVLGLLFLPDRGRPRRAAGITVRRGHVLLVLMMFSFAHLPLASFGPAVAWAGGGGPVPGTTPANSPTMTPTPVPLQVLHYHPDHLSSTQLITDGDGNVVQHLRYKPYGEVRGRWDRQLSSMTSSFRFEFTGYEGDTLSGLQNAGTRYYDPSLAQFLTRDPARQFASPYSYGGGDPLNWTDPSGEDFGAILIAAVVAAVATAAVNSLVAAAQGASPSQIGKAALHGAVSGAVGVGLGVVFAGANIALAAASNTLPAGYGGLQGAAQALGEVAIRSAASTIASNAAGQIAGAAGLPKEGVIGLRLAAGYVAAAGFDGAGLNELGQTARAGYQTISSLARHQGQTAAAASQVFGNPEDIDILVSENLRQDGSGLLSPEVLNNQTHFGALARATAGEMKQVALSLHDSGADRALFLKALGSASHYVQDQYALGHIFPGTHLFAGPWGAIPRFIIHQTFGGEASFVQGQYNATVDLFRQVATGSRI